MQYTIKSAYTIKKDKDAFVKSLAFLTFNAIMFLAILPFTITLLTSGRYIVINITFLIVSIMQLVQLAQGLAETIKKWKKI